MAIVQNTIRWDDNTKELKKNLQDGVKSLEDMKGAVESTGSSWGNVMGGLNIEGLMTNPMGAAKQAAFGLAESIGGVALTAAATVASVVAIGAAIFKLASDAAAVGAGLDDMADKTGMSVPALSRLSNAAAIVGADMRTLTDIVFKLEKGIGDNTEAFQKGLAKMGLTTAELKAAGPDRYLELITKGLNSIPDAADRASAGTAIMGRGFKDVAATLIDLKAGFDLTADITPWSAEQAADAEKFEMQMKSIWVHAEALAMGLGRALIPAVAGTVEVLTDVAGWLFTTIGYGTGLIPIVHGLSAAWGFASAALAVYRGEAEKIPEVSGDAKKGVDNWKKSVDALALSVGDGVDSEREMALALKAERLASKDLTDQVKASITEKKKAVKVDDDWQKILKNLDSAGGNWLETLEDIDGEVVEAIKYYLKAGVSQGELQKAYGLTAVEIKAVSTSLEEEKKWLQEVERIHTYTTKLALQNEKEWRDEQQRLLKRSNDNTAKSLEETGRLWDEYYDDIDKETLSTTDYQIKQVDRWFDAEVAKLKDDDAAWGLHYDALYAKAEQNKKQINDLNDPFKRAQKEAQDKLKGDWDHFLGDVYGGFSQTFSTDIVNVLFGDGGFKDVWHNLWTMLKDDVKAILADLLNNVVQGFIEGMAKKLGGFFAGLAAGGGKGAGFWGMLAGLLAGGFGGGGTTPIEGGYFDENNNWVNTGPPGLPPGFMPPPIPEDPRHESDGGIVYAGRGRVINWEPMGTDVVPAMLTPGELVLTEGQTGRIANTLHAAESLVSSPSTTVVLQERLEISFPGLQVIDGADLDTFVEKKVMPRFTAEIEDRRRGYAGRIARVMREINVGVA